MRAGSQHVRATVREPLGWRSWHGVQACGVRHAQPVRAAPPHGHARCGCGGQCGCAVREPSHTAAGRPCQGAQAPRCSFETCRGELCRTLAADPPPQLCVLFSSTALMVAARLLAHCCGVGAGRRVRGRPAVHSAARSRAGRPVRATRRRAAFVTHRRERVRDAPSLH